MFNRILRLIRQLAHRGALIKTAFNNGVDIIQYSGTGGDSFKDVEKIEAYGFASRASAGAEVLALSLGGNGSHTVAVLVGDRRYRMDISEGDVAVYDMRGNYAWLKESEMEVSHQTKVTINAPDVEIVGNVTITGDVSITGDSELIGAFDVNGNTNFTGTVKANNVAIDETHTHSAGGSGPVNP